MTFRNVGAQCRFHAREPDRGKSRRKHPPLFRIHLSRGRSDLPPWKCFKILPLFRRRSNSMFVSSPGARPRQWQQFLLAIRKDKAGRRTRRLPGPTGSNRPLQSLMPFELVVSRSGEQRRQNGGFAHDFRGTVVLSCHPAPSRSAMACVVLHPITRACERLEAKLHSVKEALRARMGEPIP